MQLEQGVFLHAKAGCFVAREKLRGLKVICAWVVRKEESRHFTFGWAHGA
jgi:hypothetical protein